MTDTARVRHAIASAEDADQRIDNFLFKQLKGVPKGHVYRLLRKGQVRVNGKRSKPTQRLVAGDDVRIPPVRQRRSSSADPGGDYRWLARCIIYEDDSLLVLDKPSGLAVHGGSGVRLGVIEALRALRPKAPFLELVHRLDRDTSGCLMVAKKRSRLRAMHALLREGKVEKKYLALLSGRLNDARWVDAPLHKYQLASGERRVRVDAEGKAARTHFKPLGFYGDATLVEARIVTGRTHQIRVHAAHLGHPIAGDSKYAPDAANRAWHKCGLKRLFLHAASVGFDAPWNDAALVFSAPLERGLTRVLDQLPAR